MAQSYETLYNPAPGPQCQTLAAQRWKCIVVHLRDEECASRATEHINGQGDKTEHG